MHRFDVGKRLELLGVDRPAKRARAEPVKPRRPQPNVPPSDENFLERIIRQLADEDAINEDVVDNNIETDELPTRAGAKRSSDGAIARAGPPPPPPPEKHHVVVHKRQPNKLSMQSYMLQLMKADADEEADKLANTRVHLKWEYEVLNLRFKGECVGDMRIKKKRGALEFIYTNITEPSKQQRLMHLGLEAISYASFYGDELNEHLVRILREHNWSELRTEAIIEAPRRFGKSVGTCMDAAAEIVTQPGNPSSEYGHDVLFYANNHRASKMDLLQTYKYVKVLSADPAFGGKIESLNKNESLNFITRDGYVNTMYCYPAKPDNLRGTGSKYPTGTVIAEEFAYWPEDLFFSVLAPTLTRRNVKFFGITTVNGSDSFVSPLTQAKYPDGRSVFLCMNFQLICAECKAAHREHLCKCLLGDLPHWQSSAQHEKLSIIMERKIGKFLQEIKGLSIDETVAPAFCQVSCDFLRTPEAIMATKEIYSEIVYTAVDPACGGKYSKFAIISAIFRDNLMIVSSFVFLFLFVHRNAIDLLFVFFCVGFHDECQFLRMFLRLPVGLRFVPFQIVNLERAEKSEFAQFIDVFRRVENATCIQRCEETQHKHEVRDFHAIQNWNILRQSPSMALFKYHCLKFARHVHKAEENCLRRDEHLGEVGLAATSEDVGHRRVDLQH